MRIQNYRMMFPPAFGAFALLLAGVAQNAQASNWITTGSLNVARELHTATLLTNGQVLVTGGYGIGGYLASVESYDPVSGIWTTNNSMHTARRAHTATLLPDGSVLVVGGHGGGGSLTNVESYDPASGMWTRKASLTSLTSREAHTATLLTNGLVLAAGGLHVSGFTSSQLSSALLYDPTSDTWAVTTAMHYARYSHTATLLPDGRVLVAGGYGKATPLANGSLNSVELYDPSTATWITNASLQMNVHRDSHTATLLRDGQVLVAGGETSGSQGIGQGNTLLSTAVILNSAELYDPVSGTWTPTGSMHDARRGHTAVLLPNGHVLVAGGYNTNNTYLASVEDYDPNTRTWTLKSPLNTGRLGHSMTLLPNGSVLVAGGYNSGYLTSAELLSPPVFSDIEAGLPGAYQSPYLLGGDYGAVWGDYDNDGRLDILLLGLDAGNNQIDEIWHNTGGNFTNDTSYAPLPDGTVWSDFNNDGLLDILDDYYGIETNSGSGFININAGLPKSYFGTVALGDYDNDGQPDFLVGGYTYALREWDQLGDYAYFWATNSSTVWHNTSDGFVPIKGAPPSLFYGTVSWGDFDGDGRLDILVTGIDPNTVSSSNPLGTPVTQIWRNTGNGFTNINAGLPGVAYGTAVWGDYDNDGRLDILLTGATNLDQSSGVIGPFEASDGSTPATGLPTGFITQVWRNTGNGFTNINAGLPGVWLGSANWGDYDNDGRLDIVLTGATNSFVINVTNSCGYGCLYVDSIAYPTGLIAQVWRNTGSGFTNLNAGLPGVVYGSAAWGDYDNDGRLDILLSGASAISATGTVTAAISQVWRNNVPFANTPPMTPTGLNATASGNSITFSWNAATDAQTPQSGLNYNLRVGTSPGGSDLVSPMSLANGFRQVPQMGNAQENLSRTINGLPMGQPIYWSVQAIDTAFAGSAFAPEQTLTYNSVFTPSNGVPVPGDINGDGIVDQSELAAVLAYLNGNGMVSLSELDVVLSNYWPYSPWLYLTNVAGLGGTNVTFTLSNSIAGSFSVEYTTNFTDWNYLGPATPRYLFTDTNAPTVPQRFYRLRWP